MSLSLSSPFSSDRAAPSLHRRFILLAGVAGFLVVAVLAVAANLLLSREIDRQGNARIADAGRRAHLIVTDALEQRIQDARVVASSPEVISAAREGGARAKSLGITGADIKVLEERFNVDRSMQVAPATREYLRSLLPQLDVAEMLLTDANGYNAVITERSSDFVQSDEAWWQTAWRDGLSSADAAFDSSAHQTTVSIASVVRDPLGKVGVVKLAFSVTPLVQSLATAGAGVRVDVLDSTDHVLIGSDSSAAGTLLRGMPTRSETDGATIAVVSDSVREHAATFLANGNRWRVTAHLPDDSIALPFRSARYVMNGTALLLILVLLALLVAMNGFLRDRIARPAAALAHAAEGVAGGNFDLDFQASAEDDEIGRLSRAVGGMIHELRRLAGTIAASARETRAMSVEISAGTEEMAASAGEIASTASDLSAQANSMATSIGALAKTSVALRGVASALERGARDGVARNAALKTLALENRGGLDAGDQALATLAGDVSDSAHAVESLGAASEEIREFVALVRALARQSKLLSLNAAMEAARAGEHGKGFAVVAAEVRRLSTMSSEAADRTGTIMKAVLAGIERSRETSERALGTASDVRAATVRASSSFSEIERAVAESEAWTTTLEHAALETTELVREINLRIDELAGGTETFAAAMEQVAASSQEQSASTEQIAGAASSLGSASEKLSLIVGAMRVSGSQSVIQIPP